MRFLSAVVKDPACLRGTALLRLDFNTTDDWRMKAVLPTIALLRKRADRVVIVSHRGRPEGADRKLSLRKEARDLAKLIGHPVVFINHFRFAAIRTQVAHAPRGTVFLLENLRFLPGEEKNDARFARKLASLADYYVNDAFAVSHRANASVVAITTFLPSYAGLELEREIASLGRVMRKPARPLTVILGGAKASDKLGVIKFFRRRADAILLGGGSANTMLALRGTEVEQSLRDRDPKDLRALRAVMKYPNLAVPVDAVWHDGMIWDVGPKTEELFTKKIAAARTVIWSGPLGFIERPAFAKGSIAVARAIGRNRRAYSVAGGGETVMFLKKYRLDRKFSFISTGGGAMLDFLAGKKLPGIEALK